MDYKNSAKNITLFVMKTEYTEDVNAFEISYPYIAKNIDQHSSTDIKKIKNASHEFGSIVAQSAEYISLFIGTFFAVKKFYNHLSKKDREEMREMWESALIESGLPEKKSKEISHKFIDQVIKSIDSE